MLSQVLMLVSGLNFHDIDIAAWLCRGLDFSFVEDLVSIGIGGSWCVVLNACI